MDERSELLLEMILCNDCLTQQDASVYFGVSARTIRNSLDNIDRFLIKKGFPVIEKVTRTSLHYSGNIDKLRKCLQTMEKQSSNEYFLNPEYRINLICRTILINKSRVTINELEKVTKFSRSTINNDIKEIKRKTLNQDMQLLFNKKEGFYFEGNESAIREAYVTSTSFIRNYIEPESLFNDDEYNLIKLCLKSIQWVTHKELTYESFVKIMDYIGITLFRIKQGKSIIDQDLNDGNYPSIKNSLFLLEKVFDLKFSKYEEQNLIKMIFHAHLINDEVIDKNLNLKLELLAGNFVNRISNELQINLVQTKCFLKNLTTHFQTIINQSNSPTKDQISQDMLEQIQKRYSNVYSAVASVIKSYPPLIDLKFNTVDNITLLTIHVVSGIEQIRNKFEKNLRVLLICNMGIGSSQLLRMRLASEFNFHSTIASSQDIESISELENNYDVVVSTVKLHDLKNYVKVSSPYISDSELKALKTTIDHLVNKKVHLDYLYQEKELKSPMLKELLTSKTIQTGVDVKNWEDAIRKAGKILVQTGAVNDQYIDRMIDVVHKFGSYIVVLPGIALAHASPNDGVNHVGLSLITLNHGINFGNEKNDPVYTVICLAAIDNDTHLKALSELVQLLNSESFVKKLRGNCKTDILHAINQKSEE